MDINTKANNSLIEIQNFNFLIGKWNHLTLEMILSGLVLEWLTLKQIFGQFIEQTHQVPKTI